MIEQHLEATVPNKPMLKREELAELLDCPAQSLAKMAMNRQGPPFVKLGRSVRYPRPGVLQWLKDRAGNAGNSQG